MGRKSVGAIAAEGDWRADSDMRTLIEAEQIKKDPKRLKAAQAAAKKKMLEVATVAGGDAD